MLFNSYAFLLGFLPASLVGMALVGRHATSRTILLLAVSLFFYAWWDWRLLPLLIGSITTNYLLGVCIRRLVRRPDHRAAGHVLAVGITFDLLVLGFFKYLLFVTTNVDMLTGKDWTVVRLVLPLGISFWTFEQISFLVDLKRGAAYRLHPLQYALFVLFFPRLVAGPILRFSEIAPQITDRQASTVLPDIAAGLSIFFVGLAKKAWLADGIAPFVGFGFRLAGAGPGPDLFTAWGAALGYTCQLYFDFSGYSDMAIGLARCFGIRFPANFNSPYKATGIVEFWRRWHMTLSRFLRDYLYIPLGGNRHGSPRRYMNLVVTMLLGGLWHGAAWTFVIWGGLHGLYLMINHAWTSMRRTSETRASAAARFVAVALTFTGVVIGWVFFRSPDLTTAWHMLRGMVGTNGVAIPAELLYRAGPMGEVLLRLGVTTAAPVGGYVFVTTWALIAALLSIAWFAPNTQQIMRSVQPTLEGVAAPAAIRWAPTPAWGMAIGVVAAIGLLSVTRGGIFLYWQF
jgi:D-alanyl-lipoteichoic acid acyltransferase DltB (MBOAT superfamily)